MAQLVQKPINSLDHALSTGIEALGGCYASVLTGSGWTRVQAHALLHNGAAVTATATLHLIVDGVDLAATPGGMGQAAMPATLNTTIHLDLPLRMGAGQHTFQLSAVTDAVGVIISGYQAALTVNELGY